MNAADAVHVPVEVDRDDVDNGRRWSTDASDVEKTEWEKWAMGLLPSNGHFGNSIDLKHKRIQESETGANDPIKIQTETTGFLVAKETNDKIAFANLWILPVDCPAQRRLQYENRCEQQ